MKKPLSKATTHVVILTHPNVSVVMTGFHVDLKKVRHIATISNIILPAGLLAEHIPRWVSI